MFNASLNVENVDELELMKGVKLRIPDGGRFLAGKVTLGWIVNGHEYV